MAISSLPLDDVRAACAPWRRRYRCGAARGRARPARPWPWAQPRSAQATAPQRRCPLMRRTARENAPCALAALAGCAALAWLGLYGFAWNDYDNEARPAFDALVGGHLEQFLRLAPAYGGSLVERAPFALLAHRLGRAALPARLRGDRRLARLTHAQRAASAAASWHRARRVRRQPDHPSRAGS